MLVLYSTDLIRASVLLSFKSCSFIHVGNINFELDPHIHDHDKAHTDHRGHRYIPMTYTEENSVELSHVSKDSVQQTSNSTY